MNVWVSHLTSFQHPLGVTAIQVTVSPPAWSMELSLREGQISGNAHEVIGTTAGKWGHADKVLAECGRCSYSVKHVEVYFASQADQLAPVHKTDLSFILFSTEGPSLWFSRENQCQRRSSSSAVSSMHLLLASSTEEENHLKGRAERTFVLLPPGRATRGDLLFQILAPEPARKHKLSSQHRLSTSWQGLVCAWYIYQNLKIKEKGKEKTKMHKMRNESAGWWKQTCQGDVKL